jgi:hypothetical protein
MKTLTVVGCQYHGVVRDGVYCTVDIIVVDGKRIRKSAIQGGFGTFPRQVAADWLEKNGNMPGRKHFPSTGKESLYEYCQRHGIEYKEFNVDMDWPVD